MCRVLTGLERGEATVKKRKNKGRAKEGKRNTRRHCVQQRRQHTEEQKNTEQMRKHWKGKPKVHPSCTSIRRGGQNGRDAGARPKGNCVWVPVALASSGIKEKTKKNPIILEEFSEANFRSFLCILAGTRCAFLSVIQGAVY